jgi:hypothetical protein
MFFGYTLKNYRKKVNTSVIPLSALLPLPPGGQAQHPQVGGTHPAVRSAETTLGLMAIQGVRLHLPREPQQPNNTQKKPLNAPGQMGVVDL